MNVAPHSPSPAGLSRRRLLQQSAGLAVGSLLAHSAASAQEPSSAPAPRRTPAANPQDVSPAAVRKNIRQSLCHWCFKEWWDVEELIVLAKRLGCASVELLDPQHWPLLKKHDMVCAISSSHSFREGMNDPRHWDFCLDRLRTRIDQCAEFGFPNVITFTGYRGDIPDDVGQKNCVAGYKKIVGYAEKKGVTLCLEMLNTRDDSHPMKGHPGYQGDHTDYCIDILKQVGSPRLKLLFDVYHVQIMDGDVIRRIRQYSEYIAHVHTAGNPGRGELDAKQEINYPAVMQALVDVGYQGYVGQEFIPTRDPLEGLQEAIRTCDV